MEMGELLCSAPYYQNVRKHKTRIGEILCTGKGCVGCNPKKNGDESIVRMLGDVDSVDFEMEANDKRIKLKTRERSETAPGCYGNNIIEKNGRNKKKMMTAKRLPKSRGKITPKILVSNCLKYENKEVNMSGRLESSKLPMKKKIMDRNETLENNAPKITSNNYLTVPSRPKISALKRTCKEAKKVTNLNKKERGKYPQKIINTDVESNFGTRRRLYNTFPGAGSTSRSLGNCRVRSQETTTKFLEMLKSSEEGICDPKMMEVKKPSIWIERILRQGVSEEELLPRIPQALKVRKSGDGSEKKTTDKKTQTSLDSRERKRPNLPRLSLNGKVEVRGGESILIIEHEHDTREDRDGVLFRIGFALEERGQLLKTTRNFPKFSIIEIADGLDELVQMGAIKVIQRRSKRWLVLVEGKNAKDFLLQNGMVLGGRHFELTEIKTF